MLIPSAITGATGWLTLVNLFFSGIASGALVFEFLVIVPAMKRQPAHLSALIHRLVLGELDLPMRVLPPASMLSGFTGLALVFVKSDPSTAYTVLYVIGFAAMATMGISTATLSHPINIAISKWPIESLLQPEPGPRDYIRMRQRWDRVMVVRCLLGVGAFVCFLVATLGSAR